MSIFHDLIATYDANAKYVGKPVEHGEPLCPISHNIYNAQIEITLDSSGDFLGAAKVEKEGQRTIIPTTEVSSGRTSNPDAAHPLCEQLEYIPHNLNSKKHKGYLKQLSDWANSPYSHPVVNAVFAYVKSNTILKDLAGADVITLTEDGKLAPGNINATVYGKCLVRWRVMIDGESVASWECSPLFTAYQEYYKTKLSKTGLCVITGQEMPLVSMYDKGLILTASGAKLVSSSDISGFTYRGRFDSPDKVASLGYEPCQKAHRALRWIVNQNGVTFGTRTYVCWSPSGTIVSNPINLLPKSADFKEVLSAPAYRKKLIMTIEGYRNSIPEDESVIVASFDAATTGRMAVTQYSSMSASTFYENVLSWYDCCCWNNYYFGVKTPSIKEIVNYAFGTEQSGNTGNSYVVAHESALHCYAQQLYHCIVDGSPIPHAMVKALSTKASHLIFYNSYNREALLTTACAVIRKYENDKYKKEVWKLALDECKLDRSYQFGRLMAIYEKIERDTYGTDERREPLVIRQQQVFRNRPMTVAMQFSESAGYYLSKQPKPGIREWYRKQIDQVMALIAEFPEEERNKPLNESYLLGYSLQRIALAPKKNTNEEEKENEQLAE